MDKQQAQTIIKETFEKSFDRDRFNGFIKNLLNQMEDAPFSYQGNYIPDAYKPFISRYERIGKYNDGEKRIDILTVYLNRKTSIERARTSQRNFIAGYLDGKYGSDVSKDAALVAFVSPNEEDWRFSLVKMDYRFEPGKGGKVKVKEEFTPARRWSFLVGKNESSHTAQSRLVPILTDDQHDPTLAQMEEAFNIEKVTKEFFGKYRELFLWTKETLDKIAERDTKIKADFEAKGVNTVDFAKKLLGQIVFLYFLQKKGWFGVERDAEWGTGTKQFLRELFQGKHRKYGNFFNDILEPLFYDALSRDRSDIDHWNDQFRCKIPFLNGGLFDPIGNYSWYNTDILLPNELFSNQNKTKEGDKGNGILDIFDRYNFTVKEDEPLEKEVAVDPEMLGKVFENLLAVKDRKSKGTYYTPREIVHYMCQQSLINYLNTELNKGVTLYQDIGDIQTNAFGNEAKVGQLDLTVKHKSGPEITKNDIETLIKYGEQFGENEATVEARGKETDTYSYKLSENIRRNAKLIDEKLANIKVCDPAIGSGAFPVGMMHEIVRVRDVLSAFIQTPDRTVYHFKRECIEKSLYGVDIDPGAVEIAKLRLWLSLVVDEKDIKQIKPLPNLDYKIVCGNSLLGVEKNLFNRELFDELERLKPLYFNETSPRKKQEYKQQIDKLISQITNGHKEFDFEVYFSEVFHEKGGFDVVIANPPYDVYEGHRKNEIKEIRKMKIYEKAQGGKLNAYKLFLAKSSELQKNNGILCEIFQNSFLADSSATRIRKYYMRNKQVITIDSFPERDDVSKRVFENAKMSVCILLCQNTKRNNYGFTLNIWHNRYMDYFTTTKLIRKDIEVFDPDNWMIPSATEKEIAIVRRMAIFPKLMSIARCYQGEINLTFHKEYLSTNKTGRSRIVKGAAVQRYHIRHKMSQGENEYVDKNKYLRDNSGSKAGHHKNQRIVMQGITGVDEERRLKATILEKDIFCGHSVNYVLTLGKECSLKYLLSLFNSTLMNWYFKVFSTNSNVNCYEVNNLPIPQIDCVGQQPFIVTVDRILAITKDEDYLQNPQKQSQVKALEREIDQLVYQLYDLTEEEIRIVEKS